MALVRILVDGYSLLHNWPELAPGKARHSAAAREELIHWLTRYRDAADTPVTIFFDGTGARRGPPEQESDGPIEVLYSRTGQTADQMIERAAHRFKPYGEVLVVTDDNAERDIVVGMGAAAVSCLNFIRMVESALTELAEDVKHYNRREQNRFRQSR